MRDDDQMLDALQDIDQRRRERRDFFRNLIGVAGMAGALQFGLGVTPVFGQTAPTDGDVLNFALNLEYLEAQFYAFAVNGTGLAASDQTGTGTQGAVTGGRQVNFTDPVVAQYARETAADAVAHVNFLRAQLGASAVSQPAIDIGSTPTGAFSPADTAPQVMMRSNAQPASRSAISTCLGSSGRRGQAVGSRPSARSRPISSSRLLS